MEISLSHSQLKVVNATEPKILCLSAASSGKTRTLTARIKHLIYDLNIPPQNIVAITFTNLAAEEMKKRIGALSQNCFIGTIHSYANMICNKNKIPTAEYISTQNFDKILEKAVQINSRLYPRIKHLLVDECQDLSPLEYAFLEKIPTENSFFVGDDRQSIYGFRGSSDEYLINMNKDINYKKYYLRENYRNAPNILEFAEDFLGSAQTQSPDSIPIKEKNGILEQCSFNDALDDLVDSGNWGSWFILTRTNNELFTAQNILNQMEIPNIMFRKGDLNIEELSALMQSNNVKVLTIHTAKGLENKNVIVIGARVYNLEERKIAYVAATRAQSSLYWCPSIASRKKNLDKKGTQAGRLFSKIDKRVSKF